jgi:hypothetical protein
VGVDDDQLHPGGAVLWVELVMGVGAAFDRSILYWRDRSLGDLVLDR